MSKSARIEPAPIAVESARKKILRTVQGVERESEQFIQRYSSNVGSSSNWANYIRTAGDLTQRPYDSMRDYKELELVLKRVRGDPELDRYSNREYDELRRMIERAKMFEYLEYTVKNDLVGAYEDQLEKIGLSFYHKSYGHDLKSVKEYETKIVDWRREIQGQLNTVDHDMDEVDKYVNSSLSNYIHNYPAVANNMESSCRGMIAACQPIKAWIAEDALYPKNLQDEISTYTKSRPDLKEAISITEESQTKEEKRLKRTAMERMKLEKELVVASEKQQMLKSREQDVHDRYVRTDAELKRKAKDYQEFNSKRRDAKQNNSQSDYDYWTEMSDAVQIDMKAMEEKMGNLSTQLSRVTKDRTNIQKEVQQLAERVDTMAEQNEVATSRVQRHENNLNLMLSDVDKREENVIILKKIRELKLNGNALKKIEKFGYRPQELINERAVVNDETREAFEITSDAIGKDWAKLYTMLPFQPPRDELQLARDAEIIDTSHHRLDQGYALTAQKSLEKWRRLSSTATVSELTRTLRKMRRHDIADKIPAPVDHERARQRNTNNSVNS